MRPFFGRSKMSRVLSARARARAPGPRVALGPPALLTIGDYDQRLFARARLSKNELKILFNWSFRFCFIILRWTFDRRTHSWFPPSPFAKKRLTRKNWFKIFHTLQDIFRIYCLAVYAPAIFLFSLYAISRKLRGSEVCVKQDHFTKGSCSTPGSTTWWSRPFYWDKIQSNPQSVCWIWWVFSESRTF